MFYTPRAHVATGPEEAIWEWSGHNQNGGSGGPPPENFEKCASS